MSIIFYYLLFEEISCLEFLSPGTKMMYLYDPGELKVIDSWPI